MLTVEKQKKEADLKRDSWSERWKEMEERLCITKGKEVEICDMIQKFWKVAMPGEERERLFRKV